MRVPRVTRVARVRWRRVMAALGADWKLKVRVRAET